MSKKNTTIAAPAMSADDVANILQRHGAVEKDRKEAKAQAGAAVVMYTADVAYLRGGKLTREDTLEIRAELASKLDNPNVLNPSQEWGKMFSHVANFGTDDRFMAVLLQEASFGKFRDGAITPSGLTSEGQTKPRLPSRSKVLEIGDAMLADAEELAGKVTADDLRKDGEAFILTGVPAEKNGKPALRQTSVEKVVGRCEGGARATFETLKEEIEVLRDAVVQYQHAISFIQLNRRAVAYTPLPTLGEQ